MCIVLSLLLHAILLMIYELQQWAYVDRITSKMPDIGAKAFDAKGVGLVALRQFKMNEVVFTEKPYVLAPNFATVFFLEYALV